MVIGPSKVLFDYSPIRAPPEGHCSISLDEVHDLPFELSVILGGVSQYTLDNDNVYF